MASRLDAWLGCLETPDAKSDSGNAKLCGNCSKALKKPLVCARCKTATYCSKDCQVLTAHRKRGLAIKAVIDYSNAHANTNVTG